MFTLLVLLGFIALCFIYALQYQVVRDYKPIRYVTWDGLLEEPQNARFKYCAIKITYSIFSLKDYINE